MGAFPYTSLTLYLFITLYMISISIVKSELLIVSLVEYRVTQTCIFNMCHNTMQYKLWKLFLQVFYLKLSLPGKALSLSNMKKV